MKVSELRLGNLILHNGEVMPVVQIERHYKTIFRLNDLDVDERIIEDHFQPIPLTPEWLDRFGFKIPDDHGYMMRVYNGVVRIKIDDRLKYPSAKIGEIHCSVTQFVHQLQNLYFALTGEELTINNEHLQTTS